MQYDSITKNKWIYYDYIQGTLNDLTHPICSNFITFSLNTKQLLAQHIPLLRYT